MFQSNMELCSTNTSIKLPKVHCTLNLSEQQPTISRVTLQIYAVLCCALTRQKLQFSVRFSRFCLCQKRTAEHSADVWQLKVIFCSEESVLSTLDSIYYTQITPCQPGLTGQNKKMHTFIHLNQKGKGLFLSPSPSSLPLSVLVKAQSVAEACRRFASIHDRPHSPSRTTFLAI